MAPKKGADWSPEENVLNATLPLKGAIDFHLFVSAVGSGDSEQTLRGPGVQLNASVPLDSYELSAIAIDSSRAVISWHSSERADIFKYKTTERGQWTTCDESANCEATVNHGRTRVFTSGDLILTQQSLRDYVWVRCCNNHGCGNPDHGTLRSYSVGHPSITAATVIPDKQSTVVKFVPRRESSYEDFEVKWRCNGDKEATSNYEFSKREFSNPYHRFDRGIRMQETTINDRLRCTASSQHPQTRRNREEYYPISRNHQLPRAESAIADSTRLPVPAANIHKSAQRST
ncbi:uncharacterized protein LOC144095563 [Amblyomma americanum]